MPKRKRSEEGRRERKLSAYTWQQLDEAVQIPEISAKELAHQFHVGPRTLANFLSCFPHPDPNQGRLTFRKLKALKSGKLKKHLGDAYYQPMMPKPADLTAFTLAQFFELSRLGKSLHHLRVRLGGVTEQEVKNHLAFYGTTFDELHRLSDKKISLLVKKWPNFYIPFKELSQQSERDEVEEDKHLHPRKGEKRLRMYSESPKRETSSEDLASESKISSSDSKSEIEDEEKISERKSADEGFPHFRYDITPKITSVELADEMPWQDQTYDETSTQLLFDEESLSIFPLDSEEGFAEMMSSVSVPHLPIPTVKMPRVPTIVTSRYSAFDRSHGVNVAPTNGNVAAANNDDDQVDDFIVQGISM